MQNALYMYAALKIINAEFHEFTDNIIILNKYIMLFGEYFTKIFSNTRNFKLPSVQLLYSLVSSDIAICHLFSRHKSCYVVL